MDIGGFLILMLQSAFWDWDIFFLVLSFLTSLISAFRAKIQFNISPLSRMRKIGAVICLAHPFHRNTTPQCSGEGQVESKLEE